MDEETRGLSTPEPGSRAAALEAEATALRRRVDELLAELDRREDNVASRLALVRRYAIPALLTTVILGGAVYAAFRWRERSIPAWPPKKIARAGGHRLSRFLS